jgi:soluble lytic murein transglycosylase-like protein
VAPRRLLFGLCLCLAIPGLPSSPPAPSEAAMAPGPGAPARPADPRVGRVREQLACHHTGLGRFELEAVARTVVEEAERHGVPAALVLGVIQVESGYYNFAVSRKGALGLMQIMPATGRHLARELGVRWDGPATLFDPVRNVRLGVAYLARLERRYGRLDTALAAYNWGPGAISARLRDGLEVPEDYARDVLDAYGRHALRASRPTTLASAPRLTSAATKASTAAIASSSALR